MRYLFNISGVPVHCRVLPSGDLAVWHPYNVVARRIIEPICRPRGYWDPDHRNWVVARHQREYVLAALDAAGGGRA